MSLRLILIAVPLTACVSSTPVGGTPSTDASSGSEEGSSGAAETDDIASSGDVDETHLSILEDCGIELSCDPLFTNDVDSVTPQEAYDCALALYAAGTPAMVGHSFYAAESAILMRADRRMIRQSRPCAGTICEGLGPWGAWGSHQLCEAIPTFGPGPGGDCIDVPDFTCDELLAFLAEPSNPPVPCEDRPQEACDGLFDLETDCRWVDALPTYESDSCESATAGTCLSLRWRGDCELNPTCEGAGTQGVFFREREDGRVDILADDCPEPVGFERCSWGEPGTDDPPGPLAFGPAACECACVGE
jgi:hypothetical protein